MLKIEKLKNKSVKVFGYFTEWSIYQREYDVNLIPVNQLTHILYAFMLPNPSKEDYELLKKNYPFPPNPYNPNIPEGKLVSHDYYAWLKNIEKLKKLKIINPNVKILVSVGGWSLSWIFSKIFKNKETRKQFVESAVQFVVINNFDGIDIDWEYPGKQGIGYNYVDPENDIQNFIETLKELRKQFNRYNNKYYEITAAVGASPDVIEKYKDIHQYLDYVLLMAYDFAGHWGDGGHHAGLYYSTNANKMNISPDLNVASAVDNAINKMKCPKYKICLGCPLYGRGWCRLDYPKKYMEPPFGINIAGPAKSHNEKGGEPGITSWKYLRRLPSKDKNFEKCIDSEAEAVFMINRETGELWSFDDLITIRSKARYVIHCGLGGMMFWELSDDERDENSLLNAAVCELNKLNKLNENEELEDYDGLIYSEIKHPELTGNKLEDNENKNKDIDNVKKMLCQYKDCYIVLTNNDSSILELKPGEKLIFRYWPEQKINK